ncbi:MAG: hypothetical protein WAK35_13370 [Xanthobacteraceae bacterium]
MPLLVMPPVNVLIVYSAMPLSADAEIVPELVMPLAKLVTSKT